MKTLAPPRPFAVRLPTWTWKLVLWAIVCFCAGYALAGCATIRKQAWTGGGAAAGAAAGALVGGPVGAAVGGAAGAITVGATAEAQEYRDGDVVGEEALKKQSDFWRGTALAAQAQAGTLETWLRWVLAGGVLWFTWRNRAHLLAFGPGYFGRLAHAFLGTKLKRGAA